MRTAGVIGAAAIAAAAGFAQAGDVLQVDLDALTARASGAFSETFTGTFRMHNTAADPDVDGDAAILDVLIDGVAQNTGGANAAGFGFDMNLTFANGFITSGNILLTVDQAGSENTYTASVSPAQSPSILNVGGSFLIGGLTFDGMFSDPSGTLLGVDITRWGSIQPVPGFFSTITFEPNAANMDVDTDVDVFVMVPTPAAAGMAGLGLVGLGLRRRRA